MNLLKVTVETFTLIQEIYISKKCCYFVLSIHKNPEYIKLHNWFWIKKHFSMLEWFLKDHVTVKTEKLFCMLNK